MALKIGAEVKTSVYEPDLGEDFEFTGKVVALFTHKHSETVTVDYAVVTAPPTWSEEFIVTTVESCDDSEWLAKTLENVEPKGLFSKEVRDKLKVYLHDRCKDGMFGDGLEDDYIDGGISFTGLNNMTDEELIEEYGRSVEPQYIEASVKEISERALADKLDGFYDDEYDVPPEQLKDEQIVARITSMIQLYQSLGDEKDKADVKKVIKQQFEEVIIVNPNNMSQEFQDLYKEVEKERYPVDELAKQPKEVQRKVLELVKGKGKP